MTTNIKKNLYPSLVSSFLLLFFGVIYILSLNTSWVNAANMNKVADWLKILFLTAMFLLGLVECLQTNHFANLFSARNFLIFSILFSMVFSTFAWKVSAFAIGVYVFFVIIFFLKQKKIYSLNKVYFFIFLYALWLLVGTVTTPQGFHFPEVTYSFYIIPLSYSFFHLESRTKLRMLRLFFRIMLLYCTVSLIFWWFNVHAFDASVVHWFTSKVFYDNKTAYMLVSDWANFQSDGQWINYSHPTFVSLNVLSALIAGLYLYYKKNKETYVSTIELSLFLIIIFVFLLSIESRIGLISFIILLTVSILYYSKIKGVYFRIILSAMMIGGIAILFINKDRVGSTVYDEPREISYTFAVNYIKDHLWWGSGTGEQLAALHHQDEKMEDVELLPDFPPYLYAHNQFLGMMVQFGIPGLLVLIVVLGGLTVYAVRSRNYPVQMLLLIYFLCMMIEEPLYIQEGIMRFMVFFCFFLSFGDSDSRRKSWSIRGESL